MEYKYMYRDISLQNKTMAEMAVYLEELMVERDTPYVNPKTGERSYAIDRNNSTYLDFIKKFEKVKTAIAENRYTDGFEAAIQLKLWLESKIDFNFFVGEDPDLGSLFKQMTLVITRRFFDVLETVENKLKLENFSITKLLD
jgi:hypothetical protein